jgi:hypothetical protein
MKRKIFALLLPFLFFLSACNNWGDKIKMNEGEVYYKEPAGKTEAETLAKYLVTTGYFDGTPATVQLLKDGDFYTVNFVIKKGMSEDSSVVEDYKRMSPLLSYNVFQGTIVNIGLCNTDLEREKYIPGFNFGKLIRFGDDDLYYLDRIDKKTAKKFGKYLQESGFFSGRGLNAQLSKKGNVYQFKYNVQKDYEKDEQYRATARAYATLLSRDLFDSAEVEIHLCDNYFNTLAVERSSTKKEEK